MLTSLKLVADDCVKENFVCFLFIGGPGGQMMRPHMGPQGKILSITSDKALLSVEKF